MASLEPINRITASLSSLRLKAENCGSALNMDGKPFIFVQFLLNKIYKSEGRFSNDEQIQEFLEEEIRLVLPGTRNYRISPRFANSDLRYGFE